MQNNNFQNSNNEDDYDEDAKEEPISEETEEEIIDNNCIDEDEEEFIEEVESNSPKNGIIKEEIKQKSPKPIKDNKNLHHKEEKLDTQKKKINQKIISYKGNKKIESNQNKPQKNKFQAYYSPKFDFARKRPKKIEEVKRPDDLFIKAIEKTKRKNESNIGYDQEGNTFSTKITDILYDKYIGQNGRKVNTIDVISKIKDEEVRVNREALRTKEDAKKISDMLNRQEDFEKVKINKIKEKEKEMNDKISQECVFMPNGINISTRTPNDFYNSQLKFIEKKEDNLNQIYKSIIDNENKNMNVILTSKISERMASAKNPNESREDFLKRLHYEKLKTTKENIEKPKEEKKLTKEQVNDLSNKLYKEGKTFRENKDKKQKEKILKDMNYMNEELISEKSNKVLLDKFISYYEKVLFDIFNKNNNFQINFDEYKLILNNMGCINPNSQLDNDLVKESFNKYLKQKGDKIDTYAFLIFGLATLGIYKGNDEVKQIKMFSSINVENNNKNINLSSGSQKNINKLNINKRKNNSKYKYKTSAELIKMSIPNMDLSKYGYTNKVTKLIKQKFISFVKGLNGSWLGDISKKKQERREKLEKAQKEEEIKRISKNKKIIKYNSKENKKENSKSKEKNKNNYGKSNKLEDVYKIIQHKKQNDLKTLKAKKEAEELALCTFQPNINKPKNENKNINKKQIKKNIEKLYQDGKAAYILRKKLIKHDPEDNVENKINCTFKPVINQYNNEMFIRNPLKEDMKKFEKIREKRMNNIQKSYERPMNFAIESKINKEDIIDRVIPDRNSYKNENEYEEKYKEEIIPLLKVEVNLDEKNNTDKIIIYPGDNVKEKTIQFCKKHKLNEDKKNTLLNIILEKMKENIENDYKEIYENNYDDNDKDKTKDDNRIDKNNNLNNKENNDFEIKEKTIEKNAINIENENI